MNDETFLILYRASTFAGAAGAFLAAYLYRRWMPWRSTAVGRHLMGFTVLLGAVLGLSGLHSYGVSYPFQRAVSVLLLALVAGGTWHRVAYVIAKHRENERER